MVQLPGPRDAALSPDGRTLATGGVGGAVALYDLGTRRLVGQLRWAARGLSVDNAGVDISPDGRVLAYARDDAAEVGDDDIDRVALWDVPSRRELGVFDAAGVEALALAPSGDVLAVGYRDRIELRDARSQTVRQTVRIPQATAQHLSFSRDGRLLAASGFHGALLWDVSDPATIPVLAGTLVNRDDIGSGSTDPDVAFSPDSRLLAVADGGPEIILWDLKDTDGWRHSLCQMLDRGFSDQERRRFFRDSPVPEPCPG